MSDGEAESSGTGIDVRRRWKETSDVNRSGGMANRYGPPASMLPALNATLTLVVLAAGTGA
ncbi:hypothetical protein QZM25_23965 [Burkholderia contaminans]|uniref:Uncharacterized protein n=2 Tax=Burkholderiaceae TaxID=119060 RepID=A0A250LDT7_9BURK|nr:hypothetical protein [Burkholderia contaminans]MDN7575665.1 hypothetical protein [Burkholderia contaminans]BBA42764.1 hypothetical protein BCCH1_52520 [Burkholderia contaminans]GLZ68990.1 hypothetical protein Bcon01_20350 [Burkholderia contaminans]